LGKNDTVERMTVEWPSGRLEEFKNLKAGKAYDCLEAKGLTAFSGN
jgi:hypothetical protein